MLFYKLNHLLNFSLQSNYCFYTEKFNPTQTKCLNLSPKKVLIQCHLQSYCIFESCDKSFKKTKRSAPKIGIRAVLVLSSLSEGDEPFGTKRS